MRDERTIKEIIKYLKIQKGNCSNELSNVEGLCLVNYIEWLEKRLDKAIEYIEEKYEYILKDDSFLDHDERIDRKQILKVLDILKGDD